MVSGLHWTIPNGTSAPGKVLPPLLVHVRVSTSVAGSRTGSVIVAWSLAPAGSSPGRTGAGHETSWPPAFVEQVEGGVPPAPTPVAARAGQAADHPAVSPLPAARLATAPLTKSRAPPGGCAG